MRLLPLKMVSKEGVLVENQEDKRNTGSRDNLWRK